MTYSDELLTLSKLSLSGRESDIRLYLAKQARKLRKTDSALGSELEKLLKSFPTRSSGVLRKSSSRENDGKLLTPDSDDTPPLLKSPSQPLQLEPPLMSKSLNETLAQVIHERSEHKNLNKAGLSPTSSLIFQGPPGVGKTITAQWLAYKLNLPFYILDLTAVMSSDLGKTGSNLRSVIEFAKTHPCILLLDEIDAIAKKRSDEADVGELKRLVTVMLQELEHWPAGGILIAATNHPELVDPALWRRFDIEIAFSLPSSREIKLAVDRYLANDKEHFKPWLPAMLLSFKGKSYSDIKRTIFRLRKTRVLDSKNWASKVPTLLFPHTEQMTSKERIKLANTLVSELGLSQLKASQLTGVSRDTIRKNMRENTKSKPIG